MRYGIWLLFACVVLYTLAMEGVRYYAHHVSVAGGLLTIAAMYGAACWYERRKERNSAKALPPQVITGAPR